MPFIYRRSKKFGPLRLSLSKRGLSTSMGAKGLRVGRSATGRKHVSIGLIRGLRWFKRFR